MNRKQRRKLGPRYSNVIDMPPGTMLRGIEVTTGTEFVMPGWKRLPDNTIMKNCKPGEETTFIVNIVPGMRHPVEALEQMREEKQNAKPVTE